MNDLWLSFLFYAIIPTSFPTSFVYSIIIPAYNEELVIARAVQETQHYFSLLDTPFEIIVVDDGSRDRTAEIVRSFQSSLPSLRLIQQPSNQGKGAAVQAGALAARGTFILFLDADLSTQPSEFSNFIPHLYESDILIGSRGLPASHISLRQPAYRSWAGKLFNLLIRSYLDLPFRDTQCGFKVFHKRTKVLFEEQQTMGWAFDVELLLRAKKHGFRVRELPIHWKNDPHSKVKLTSFMSIIRELIRMKRMMRS